MSARCPYQKLRPAGKSLKSAVSAASFLCHESYPIFTPFYALVFSDPSRYANRDSCSGHQLAVLQRRTNKRPSLRTADRLLWVVLSRGMGPVALSAGHR